MQMQLPNFDTWYEYEYEYEYKWSSQKVKQIEIFEPFS